MKIGGLLLIIGSLIVAFYWVGAGRKNIKTFIFICLIGVFAGIFLVMQDRVIEVSVKGFGTIKAAAEQATSDAKQIKELRERLEAQAATVDLIAKQAIEIKELYKNLEQKRKLADQKLKDLNDTQQKALQMLSQIGEINKFTITVIAAQSDDRKAYDRLKAWADDSSYPFSSHARDAWDTIRGEHSKPFYSSGFTVPWRKDVDPSKLTLGELQRTYEFSPSLKVPLIEFIWKRENIPKKDRMQFLIDVMQNDQSLKAVEYAGRYFIDGANLKIKISPMAVEYLVNWWEDNKGKFQSGR